MTQRGHWDAIYATKPPDNVSWYRPHLERCLEFLAAAGLPKHASIIDVGGGTSTFVDDLLDAGFSNVTVMDISETALENTRRRLGDLAETVRWIRGDVTSADVAPQRFDFWHDRAVFHFLTDADQRDRYVGLVRRTVAPGGHVLVATFGPDGPEQCSGLPVVRYDPDSLHAEFGAEFRKVGSAAETHITPWGARQEFIYCYCRMSP